MRTAGSASRTPSAGEHQHGDRSHRGRRDRQLAPGDGGELGGVQPPAALEALPERVGVHVGDPEDENRDADEHCEIPRIRVGAARAGRHGRHHDDRAVDRARDGAAAPEGDPLNGVTLAHTADVRA